MGWLITATCKKLPKLEWFQKDFFPFSFRIIKETETRSFTSFVAKIGGDDDDDDDDNDDDD